MTAETPVLDTLADLTAMSLERCALPPRELMLARIAALIAVDAPPASYLANAGAAADSGITGDDVQAVMIGIAPVVGTPRVVAARQAISSAPWASRSWRPRWRRRTRAPGSKFGLPSVSQMSRVVAGVSDLMWLPAGEGSDARCPIVAGERDCLCGGRAGRQHGAGGGPGVGIAAAARPAGWGAAGADRWFAGLRRRRDAWAGRCRRPSPGIWRRSSPWCWAFR